jgi:hypothetical protein
MRQLISLATSSFVVYLSAVLLAYPLIASITSNTSPDTLKAKFDSFPFKESYAQSSTSPGDVLLGTWVNKDMNANITKAIITSYGKPDYYYVYLYGNGQNTPADLGGPFLAQWDGEEIFYSCGDCSPYFYIYQQGPTGAGITFSGDSGYYVESLEKEGTNKCPLNEALAIQDEGPENPVVVIATAGHEESVNISVNASSNNFDRIAVILSATQNDTSNPNYGLGSSSATNSGIVASFKENDFFVSPGELKKVLLTFSITSQVPAGNYLYQIDAGARDTYKCEVLTKPMYITIAVRIQPDFAVSVNPSTLMIARGSSAPTAANMTITTLKNSQSPMTIGLVYSGWNYDGKGMNPMLVESSFDNNENVSLTPGENLTRVLKISALAEPPSDTGPSTGQLLKQNYTGEFLYTIIVQGSWIENGKSYFSTKRVDIPVEITKDIFDFALSVYPESIFLEPHSSTSIKISVRGLTGRPQSVSLQAIGLSPDITMKLDNSIGNPNFNSTLTINSLADSLLSREITIVASGGGMNHTLLIPVSANPFKINVNSQTIFVKSGQSSSAIATVSKLSNEYDSVVNLSARVLVPTGDGSIKPLSQEDFVTLSFDKSSGQLPLTSTLVIKPMGSFGSLTFSNFVIVISASDGRFTDSAQLVIARFIEIDSEPRIDSIIVDGSQISGKDLGASLPWAIGEDHFIYAAPEVPISNNTRYIFESWSDGSRLNNRTEHVVNYGLKIVANYKPQYLLTIASPIQVSGAGWYYVNTSASFGIDPSVIVSNNESGAKQQFRGWSGPDARFIGYKCGAQRSGSPSQESLDSRPSGEICMDGPKTLVAMWEPTVEPMPLAYLIGGGLAAAGGIGAVVYLKFLRPGTTSASSPMNRIDTSNIGNTNQDSSKSKKPQKRDVPVLQWEATVLNKVNWNGRIFIDVIIDNVGEVDVKKIRLSVEYPQGIEYVGGVTEVDNLLAKESRKVQFVLNHSPALRNFQSRESSSPYVKNTYEITLNMSYEFMTKIIKINDKKRLRVTPQIIKIGLVRQMVNQDISQHGGGWTEVETPEALVLKEWLTANSYSFVDLDILALLAAAPESDRPDTRKSLLDCDTFIIPVFADKGYPPGLVEFLEKNILARQKSLIIYLCSGGIGSGRSGFVQTEDIPHADEISRLFGFAPSSSEFVSSNQGFGIRIVNADHPITHGLEIGDILRMIDQGGIIILNSAKGIDLAEVLAEQMIMDKSSKARVVPAIIATKKGAKSSTDNSNDTSGSFAVYFNLDLIRNINALSELLERAILS